MEETLQLLTFLFSFCYGVFFGYLSRWHFKFTIHYSVVLKYISTFLFILDIVLGYILGMYHLNEGIFHLYFLFFVFLGFIVSFSLHKIVKFPFIKREH